MSVDNSASEEEQVALVSLYVSDQLDGDDLENFELEMFRDPSLAKRVEIEEAMRRGLAEASNYEALGIGNSKSVPMFSWQNVARLFVWPNNALAAVSASVALMVIGFSLNEFFSPDPSAHITGRLELMELRSSTSSSPHKLAITSDNGQVLIEIDSAGMLPPLTLTITNADNSAGDVSNLHITVLHDGFASVVLPAQKLPTGLYAFSLGDTNGAVSAYQVQVDRE